MNRHIRILVFAIVAVLAVFILEKALPVAPGFFVGMLELILEMTTFFVLLLGKHRTLWSKGQQGLLGSSLLFLFLADFFYIYFYYLKKVGHPTPAVSLLTSLPYALCFVALSGFFWLSLAGSLKSFLRSPIALLPVLIVTPVAARLALPLFTREGSQLLFTIIESCSLFGSYSVFLVALLIFLVSREVFWVLLASGPLIFLLSDWAIKVEKFMGHSVKFVDYEFLWALGTCLFCLTLLCERPAKATHEEFDYRNIALSSRLAAFLLSFASILLVAITQREIELVKFVAVSAALGIMGAGLLAQLHLDQLNRFSASLQALLSSGAATTLDRRGWSPELERSLDAVLQTKIDELRGAEQANARMLLATQVAHDIRSPLAALNVAIATSDQMAEDCRIIVRSAVSRIRDITNNLLLVERGSAVSPHSVVSESEPPGVQLLSGLIQSLVSEKRLQYRALMAIEIDAELNLHTYGLFAELQSLEFKRLVSNLIDNAVQALGTAGKITLNLTGDKEHVLLAIVDNGPGIPPHLLSKIGQRGVTHGKPGGTGLGLYHARTTVERWGGQFGVRSSPATGTTIELTLRRAAAPSWFVEHIELSSGLTVVILDDDKAIHATWDRLLSAHAALKLSIVHFTESAALSTWLREQRPAEFLGLIDYELLRQSASGLDLVEQEGIAASSILVTSRFEEPAVLSRCARLGLRMIPKELVGLVPLRARQVRQDMPQGTSAPRVLVVDDDAMIHAVWKMGAEQLGVAEVVAFTSIEACEAAKVDYSSFDLCFIDMNIPKSSIRLEDALRHLKKRGARRVIVATGASLDAYEQTLRAAGADGFEPEKVPANIQPFLSDNSAAIADPTALL